VVHSAERRGEVFNQWTNAWTDRPPQPLLGEESDGGFLLAGASCDALDDVCPAPASGAHMSVLQQCLVSVGRSHAHDDWTNVRTGAGTSSPTSVSVRRPRFVFPRAAQRPAEVQAVTNMNGSQAQSA
jgi:hypothetical protein